MSAPHPETWLKVTSKGLYCEPGDFYIDPAWPVDRAVITHGHGDHARAGHKSVLATQETTAIMGSRFGIDFAGAVQSVAYNDSVDMGELKLRLVPAGHILGSAQIVLDYRGSRAVVSGDFKRRFDPTCPPFEPVPCDVFVTEATFALPVFRHPDDAGEIAKLLHSQSLFPERAQLVGVYALGKCQRVIALLRRAGYDAPIYLHGALVALTTLYQSRGVDLGDVRPAAGMSVQELRGQIVLCPPSALSDRWSRRLPDPLPVAASGWMRVRARAKQNGAELPLIISDHADWDELLRTVEDVGSAEIWVTHGREEALIHEVTKMGRKARALSLVGREDEDS